MHLPSALLAWGVMVDAATHLRMFTAIVLPDGSAVCEAARFSSIHLFLFVDQPFLVVLSLTYTYYSHPRCVAHQIRDQRTRWNIFRATQWKLESESDQICGNLHPIKTKCLWMLVAH